LRVITFGTFDVLHVGHLNLLERARAMGGHLTVGVSSDALNFDKKGRLPIYLQRDRVRIIEALACVDEVFIEESLELKERYILDHRADILVMGNDWQGKFDQFEAMCQVLYLTRTPSVSTTETIEVIKNR
jgi:glycerol-3-phosphate cytidylyltransferase